MRILVEVGLGVVVAAALDMVRGRLVVHLVDENATCIGHCHHLRLQTVRLIVPSAFATTTRIACVRGVGARASEDLL